VGSLSPACKLRVSPSNVTHLHLNCVPHSVTVSPTMLPSRRWVTPPLPCLMSRAPGWTRGPAGACGTCCRGRSRGQVGGGGHCWCQTVLQVMVTLLQGEVQRVGGEWGGGGAGNRWVGRGG
jgi:hypothetical protein